MNLHNSNRNKTADFIPQTESASKLEIGSFIVFILIMAGVFVFLMNL